MHINQDADIYAGILQKGVSYEHTLKKGRGSWIQVVYGEITVNENLNLSAGDGVGIVHEDELELKATEDSELILFDVVMDFETPYNLA